MHELNELQRAMQTGQRPVAYACFLSAPIHCAIQLKVEQWITLHFGKFAKKAGSKCEGYRSIEVEKQPEGVREVKSKLTIDRAGKGKKKRRGGGERGGRRKRGGRGRGGKKKFSSIF